MGISPPAQSTAGAEQPASERIDLPSAYRLAESERRAAVAAGLSRCVFIEVTNRCNLACATCARTFATYERMATLPWERFVQVVEQFPEMERAVLHGIGEPLLNPDLPRMIAYLKARRITVLFNTNATLLDESWARALIASGLDELRVSLDSTDAATYERIRGAPSLAKVIGNLRLFTRVQRATGAATPRLSLWMMALRDNIGQLPGLIELAAEIGITEVYVQRLVYYLDTATGPGLMDEANAVYGESSRQIEDILDQAQSLAGRLGVTLRASGATAPPRSLRGEDAPAPWTACLRPWTTAYVTANGNCLPCCISPFATQDYDSLKLGNLFADGFSAIWNNERYQAWRAALLGAEPPPACRGCGVHWSL